MDTQLQASKVLVVGLGVSGRAAIQVLLQLGISVLSVDEHTEQADYHSCEAIDWSGIDLVVVSPVFSPQSPYIVQAQARGIAVISEVELAWLTRVNTHATGRHAAWIGVTGTNGKTTTVQMLTAMLQAAGVKADAVGNIGKPVSLAARDPNLEVLCVELSSFQLHHTYSIRPYAAAITNIAADHLDWHGSMQAYMQDKAHIYEHVEHTIVANADDQDAYALACQTDSSPAQRISYTLHSASIGQIGIDDGWIVDRRLALHAQRLMRVQECVHLQNFQGTVYPHLLYDALCALSLALSYGIDVSAGLQALREFNPCGHRINQVACVRTNNGEMIRCVDDSKATNIHAAQASISSFEKKSVVWIAGGLSKGVHFDQLIATCAPYIKAAVIIGRDTHLLLEALAQHGSDIPVSVINAEDTDSGTDSVNSQPCHPGGNTANTQEYAQRIMSQAFQAASTYAQGGDVILLAPACASMDQFDSYAQRGTLFATCAQRWAGQYHA